MAAAARSRDDPVVVAGVRAAGFSAAGFGVVFLRRRFSFRAAAGFLSADEPAHLRDCVVQRSVDVSSCVGGHGARRGGDVFLRRLSDRHAAGDVDVQPAGPTRSDWGVACGGGLLGDCCDRAAAVFVDGRRGVCVRAFFQGSGRRAGGGDRHARTDSAMADEAVVRRSGATGDCAGDGGDVDSVRRLLRVFAPVGV